MHVIITLRYINFNIIIILFAPVFTCDIAKTREIQYLNCYFNVVKENLSAKRYVLYAVDDIKDLPCNITHITHITFQRQVIGIALIFRTGNIFKAKTF